MHIPHMSKYLRKGVCFNVIIAFIASSLYTPLAHGGELVIAPMPNAGTMVGLSQAFVPAHLQGMVIHPDSPLKFDFLVNKGDQNLDEAQQKVEYKTLVKYFLASLTVPNEHQWVNLSPYEKNRVVEDDFGKTEMGRDLLAQDYLLKQITSSLMYPESGLGKSFWNKVYERAWNQYHTTNIPVDTFNKVWILPEQAMVYESGNTAYILKSHLKVMLEEDYLALGRHPEEARRPKDPGKNNSAHTVASKVIREIILPALEKEVNEGKNFARLRQVVSGMILATWYKKALRQSLLTRVYANKSKVDGVTQPDSKANETIYLQYLAAFKKGVYNYVKEDMDTYTKESMPRKYFAGGVVAPRDVVRIDPSMIGRHFQEIDAALRGAAPAIAQISINLDPQKIDPGMLTRPGRLLMALGAGTLVIAGPDMSRDPSYYFRATPPVIDSETPGGKFAAYMWDGLHPPAAQIPGSWGDDDESSAREIIQYNNEHGSGSGHPAVMLKELHQFDNGKAVAFIMVRQAPSRQWWTMGSLRNRLKFSSGFEVRVLQNLSGEGSRDYLLDKPVVRSRIAARSAFLQGDTRAWGVLQDDDRIPVGVPLAITLNAGPNLDHVLRQLRWDAPREEELFPGSFIKQVSAAFKEYHLSGLLHRLPADKQSEAVAALFMMLSNPQQYAPKEDVDDFRVTIGMQNIAQHYGTGIHDIQLNAAAISYLTELVKSPAAHSYVARMVWDVLAGQSQKWQNVDISRLRNELILNNGIPMRQKLYYNGAYASYPQAEMEAYRNGTMGILLAPLDINSKSLAIQRLIVRITGEKLEAAPAALSNLARDLMGVKLDMLTGAMFTGIIAGDLDAAVPMRLLAVGVVAEQGKLYGLELARLKRFLLNSNLPPVVRESIEKYFTDDSAMIAGADALDMFGAGLFQDAIRSRLTTRILPDGTTSVGFKLSQMPESGFQRLAAFVKRVQGMSNGIKATLYPDRLEMVIPGQYDQAMIGYLVSKLLSTAVTGTIGGMIGALGMTILFTPHFSSVHAVLGGIYGAMFILLGVVIATFGYYVPDLIIGDTSDMDERISLNDGEDGQGVIVKVSLKGIEDPRQIIDYVHALLNALHPVFSDVTVEQENIIVRMPKSTRQQVTKQISVFKKPVNAGNDRNKGSGSSGSSGGSDWLMNPANPASPLFSTFPMGLFSWLPGAKYLPEDAVNYGFWGTIIVSVGIFGIGGQLFDYYKNRPSMREARNYVKANLRATSRLPSGSTVAIKISAGLDNDRVRNIIERMIRISKTRATIKIARGEVTIQSPLSADKIQRDLALIVAMAKDPLPPDQQMRFLQDAVTAPANPVDSAPQAQDRAAVSPGGIDVNADHMDLQIQRDGNGVQLPWSQQDLGRLGAFTGFDPQILQIRDLTTIPVLSELKQKLDDSRMKV